MGDFNVTIPKLGESIQEGTITKLFVKAGEFVKEDDVLFELATDKVDSEIPSPVAGRIKEIRCSENETYPVGEVVIIISTETKESVDKIQTGIQEEFQSIKGKDSAGKISSRSLIEEEKPIMETLEKSEEDLSNVVSPEIEISRDHFFSPLVKNIAEREGISLEELNTISGSGLGGRVQRDDLLNYIKEYKVQSSKIKEVPQGSKETQKPLVAADNKYRTPISFGAEDTVMQMDRVRKLIADHMIMSKNVAAHVTSVVEADVTNLVLWRNRIKDRFQEKYNERITFLPMITEAVAKVLNEFKMINASVDGENIILRKHINIGIAVAKENDTLIVPVIKDADTKNLIGLTKEINGLGSAARNNKILPDQLQGGTFSITNFGSFRNIIGTPIINQPQVAILAVGLIEKKPSVIETPTGDAIVVRHKMFLSLSYDHRVIDGMLGGKFLRRVADLLEQFDLQREI